MRERKISMKKGIVSVVAAVAAVVVFGAQNDLLISFSTKGPDTYADGTTVLDNECYALVWTPNGVEGTIAADGSASEGAEIVLVAPVARSGHCPNVVYRVDAGRVETEFGQGTGSWSVYLLDTRKYSYDKEGNQVVSLAGLKSDGNVKLVNASNKVGEASVRAGVGANTSLAAAVATSAETAAALPEDVPEPKVVGIEIKGGNVFVSVENAAPYLAYDLTTGDTPDKVTEKANRPATGGDDGKVILVAPVNSTGSGFFKVISR
jgi:hypothetical protein